MVCVCKHVQECVCVYIYVHEKFSQRTSYMKKRYIHVHIIEKGNEKRTKGRGIEGRLSMHQSRVQYTFFLLVHGDK